MIQSDDKFRENFLAEPNSGCWLWMSCTNAAGYGFISRQLAHRVSWTIFRGPIPKGLLVLHKCDTPACVNPDHLFLGTHADNVADKIRKGRAVNVVGIRNGKSKLTPEDVLAILASKERHSSLAPQYGVHPQTIGDIRRGKWWKHLQRKDQTP